MSKVPSLSYERVIAALRAVLFILLIESPPSLRARNLFVSENALTGV